MKQLLIKYTWLKWVFGLFSVSGVMGVIVYVVTLVIQDTDVYKEFDKTSKFRIHVVRDILPKSDSTHNWQRQQIQFLLKYVEEETTKDDFQVGLRYNISKGKLYFRDELKEYREIKTDGGGDYYRNAKDIKVYINYKAY